ncbi:MAG TPA: hypothetical protein VGN14_08945 [Candidatus Elarobacter sp.]|jgi:subtilase family serine protease
MRATSSTRLLAGFLALALLAACAGGGGSVVPNSGGSTSQSAQRGVQYISHALPGDSPTPTPSPSPAPGGLLGGLLGGVVGLLGALLSPVCTGLLHCNAVRNTAVNPNPNPHPASVLGYTPKQLWSAYNLHPSTSTITGPTIAIVDAYDDLTAESDLAIYRSQFGLPACTTANGCFSKLNSSLQHGPYPASNKNWSQEIALDLAMASAACPSCKIVLVEAASDDINLLASAVDAAATLQPAAISNSYGVNESSSAVGLDAHYNHAGIAITASVGDTAGVEFPASSSNVIAVGGTTLKPASNARGWSETAITSSGAGCSKYVERPSWQTASCSTRGVGDVSFVANAATGVAVYDTAAGGWIVLGGTSTGAPFIAGLIAAAGDYGNAPGASPVYARASALNPISGTPAGDTSLGTPNGLAAF